MNKYVQAASMYIYLYLYPYAYLIHLYLCLISVSSGYRSSYSYSYSYILFLLFYLYVCIYKHDGLVPLVIRQPPHPATPTTPKPRFVNKAQRKDLTKGCGCLMRTFFKAAFCSSFFWLRAVQATFFNPAFHWWPSNSKIRGRASQIFATLVSWVPLLPSSILPPTRFPV